MRKLYRVLYALLFFVLPCSVFAQGKSVKTNDPAIARMEASEKTAAPFSILFKSDAAIAATAAEDVFVKYLGLRKGTDELKAGIVNDFNDVRITRYQQYFKGIRVEHGSYSIAAKAGNISYLTGDFFHLDAGTSTTPALSEDAARTRAWLFMDGAEPTDAVKATGELVFVEDVLNTGAIAGKVSLAWKFLIDARTKALTHELLYVDATTGSILLRDPQIKKGCYDKDKAKDPLPATTAAANTSGASNGPTVVAPLAASIYSGNLGTMVTRQVAGVYRLEALIGSELYPNHTRSVNHALVSGFNTVAQFNTAIAASTEVTDLDNNWTAAEFNNANRDNTAFDVHWGAQRVYDYWKTRHGRNSWDNANGVLNCFVHGDVNWDNAFWQGSGGINSMFYGDGSNVAGGFSTLTCLDVTGHEIGHGVCQATAGLVYLNQSGAMNEGFSDIWGAAIERFGDPHETDAVVKSYFDIGEEITIGGGALRSMSNPKLYGQPDTYLGTNWYAGTADNGGVHTNSGVLNYWFYLLVTGKNGVNDIGSIYSVPAIGWVDAERIAFLGETSLTSNATYASCRTAMINAATTLFGACSLQTEAVTRAFYAVGVGANFVPCTPQIMFNGIAQTVTETGTTGATCLKTKTITVPVRISAAATQAATVSFTLAGTASNGANLDYTVSPATITFAAGSTTDQNLTITINNDAYVEGTETILVNINTVTTTGNATRGNAYLQYAITITDDDYNPSNAILQSSQVIYSEDFTAPVGFGQATSAGTLNIWRLGRNTGTDTYFGASNNCAYISQNTTTYTYNVTNTSIARLQTPAINTLNVSNLQLTFDYVSNGELDAGDYYDFGTLWYSTDNGGNWSQLNATNYQGVTTKTTVTVALPANAANVSQLLLGFRWDNDNSVGNQPPFGIDNIVLRGDRRSAAAVQTAVNTATSFDQQYLGPNATVNFYDKVTGAVMGTIQNLGSFDYGCTTFEVDRAGNSAQYITGDVSGNNKQRLSNKTFRVTPTTNSSTGSYKITLYYTAAEKAGYEAASTRAWVADNGANNGVKITKSPAAIGSLTTASTGVKAAIESVGTYGSDYTITAQFNNGFSGFAAGIPPLIVLPVTIVNFNGLRNSMGVQLHWKVAQQLNIEKYIVQHSVDGVNYTDIGTVLSNGFNEADYNFTHAGASAGKNFYRLKVYNQDAAFRYSSIVPISGGASDNRLVIQPNPVKENFNIAYNHSEEVSRIVLIDQLGRTLHIYKVSGRTGILNVESARLLKGVYVAKLITVSGSTITTRLIKD